MNFMLRLVGVALLVPAVAVAQTDGAGRQASGQETVKVATVQTGVPDSRSAEESSSAMRLSLDAAIASAVQQNLGVDLSRYDYRVSGYTAQAAYGPFDWFTTAQISKSKATTPVASAIQPSDFEQTEANFGISQLLATGGTYSVSWDNNRKSSNAAFTDVNPAYNSSLGLALIQPLLRDFGVDITRRGIYVARNNLGISEAGFRSALMLTTLAVQQAYYDLIFARQNLDVRQQSLDLAKDQARITKIRIDVGASAPLDILQPNVAIATREEELITAEAQIRDAEDRLRQLMNLEPSKWDQPIIPTTDIGYQPMEVDVESAEARAMQLRPEIEQAKLGIDNSRIDYLYLKNQVLPKLDFNLNYGYAGQGGTMFGSDPITGDPIIVDRSGIGDALSDILNRDFNSWTVGVNFAMPIRNVGAKARARSAELTLERAAADEAQIRQNIAVQVRQAARDIQTSARQISATRVAVEAAEQNVDAERKRFENGMTTNFNVLQIQQQLADARSSALAALVNYNKAIAAYHRAVGDILDVNSISVNPPQDFDLPESRYTRVDWLNYGHYVDDAQLRKSRDDGTR